MLLGITLLGTGGNTQEVTPEPLQPIELVSIEKEQEHWQTFVLTAYTAGYESTGKRKGDKGYGITASGEHVQEGATIACPPYVPFYTEVEIEGLGTYICHDRGGAIKGNKIDVYIADLEEALKFGNQSRQVWIKY